MQSLFRDDHFSSTIILNPLTNDFILLAYLNRSNQSQYKNQPLFIFFILTVQNA